MKLRKTISLAVAVALALCAVAAALAEPVDTAAPAVVLPAVVAIATDALSTATPTETATPTATPALEATAEITPEALPTEAPAAPVNSSVSIRLVAPETLRMGDTVMLVATLAGYDGVGVQLQWQSTRDGANWADVEGANSLSYAFTVDERTAGSSWRLSVTVL